MTKAMLSGAIAKMAEISQDVELLAAKISGVESRLSQGDGRSTYITRPECDAMQTQTRACQAQLEAKIERLEQQARADTQKIIEAIKEARTA